MRKEYGYAVITVLIWATLSTVAKLVLSFIVLHEPITVYVVLALVLIVGGILLQMIRK